MIIKVIFGQRKEEYLGQYTLEAFECISEYDHDDNPDWLLNKLKDYQLDPSLVNVKIIDVDVDGDKIYNLLAKTPLIKGDV